MSKLTTKEKELNKKLGEVFLYEYGQEYTDKICEETDALYEEFKDLEIPDSLDTWFEGFVADQKKSKRKIQTQKRRRAVSKRVAIFLAAILAVSGSVTFGVEAFRIRFLNIFFVDNETHTDLSILEGNSSESNISKPEGWNNYYYPTYLPEGYDLISHIGVEGFREVRFGSGDSNIIMRERTGETDIKSDIDTEDVEPDYLSINGSDAIYAYKEGMSSIGWLTDDTLVTLSGPIEKDEIIKIAQNVKKFE